MKDDKTKVILEDPQEIEDFKQFRQRKQELLTEDERWKRFKTICKEVGFGTLNLSVQNGYPHKADKILQAVLFVGRVN